MGSPSHGYDRASISCGRKTQTRAGVRVTVRMEVPDTSSYGRDVRYRKLTSLASDRRWSKSAQVHNKDFPSTRERRSCFYRYLPPASTQVCEIHPNHRITCRPFTAKSIRAAATKHRLRLTTHQFLCANRTMAAMYAAVPQPNLWLTPRPQPLSGVNKTAVRVGSRLPGA